MSGGFDRPPVALIHPDGVTFEMTRTVTYSGSQGDEWVVPRGFRTDFATIPAAVSWAVPKLGAYTLAAIVHDLLCVGLNEWERAVRTATRDRGARKVVRQWDLLFTHPERRLLDRPTANAVDTDAIFHRIARAHGVNAVTAALLWVGVRWGALANPARRAGWLRTAPKVLALSVLFAPVLVPGIVAATVGRLGLRALSALLRLLGAR